MTSEATKAQNRASHPNTSTWVAANAGSGKTRVLTDRVARLLLEENAPQKILCLTYTKAAAAEMQNRLFKRLGAWAMMSDADLRAALTGIGENGENYSEDALKKTRTHFARALETPGGLKIQTIHAFCASVLRRFPVEAGVSPQFREMDEGEAAGLRSEVLEGLAEQEPPVAFDGLARHLTNEAGLDGLLLDILKHKQAFGRFDREAVALTLGVDPEATDAGLCDQFLQLIAPDLSQNLCDVLQASSKPTDIKAGQALEIALSFSGAQALEAIEVAVLTLGKTPIKALPTKEIRGDHPLVAEAVERIKEACSEFYQMRLALRSLQRTADLHHFAVEFIAAYEARKAALGLLDFDDLIDRTRALLSDRTMTAWVLYRLDAGIDHVLVDEAQDTSPKQWQVIEALTAEFTDGVTASNTRRTLFVVGDKKQSIFGFQGADPNEFVRMQVEFGAKFAAVQMALAEVPLETSFRSAAPILQLVDQTFADDLGALDGPPVHKFLPEAPGRVDLWDFKDPPEKDEEPPWFEPVDTVAGNDPVNALAREVADHIAGLIADGVVVPDTSGWRPVTAGDFLVLVRSRSRFFHTLIDGLKSRGVPVAGADRLKIGQELAVRDLVSLLRFLDNELDDLSLAEALRSPVFGLSQQDLFTLAHGRSGTLWDRLRGSAHVDAVEMLHDLRARVNFVRPYELMTRVLIRYDGRKKLKARLGAECEEAIDELLAQSLSYEITDAPSLGGFLTWLSAREIEVKRDMEAGRDEVRVMTVHGAKGLEAPIVILPDTSEFSASRNKPPVAIFKDVPVWTQNAVSEPAIFDDMEDARRARETNEYARLLYVALTRAESWLIVCGAGRRNEKSKGRWYTRVANAMEAMGAVRVEDRGRGVLRIDHLWHDAVQSRPGGSEPVVGTEPWMQEMPGELPPTLKPVSPSGFPGAHALPGDVGGTSDVARRRGDVIHALLEILPVRDRSEWPDVARAVCGGAFDADEILAELRRVLDAPDLAHVFAPDVLVEVPITAELSELGQRIYGRIDRLIVRDTEVIAVDFKSNQVIPETPEQTPSAILAQMGAYAAALCQIYPDREVKTAIIWTKTAMFMALPHVSVMNALKAVTRA